MCGDDYTGSSTGRAGHYRLSCEITQVSVVGIDGQMPTVPALLGVVIERPTALGTLTHPDHPPGKLR